MITEYLDRPGIRDATRQLRRKTNMDIALLVVCAIGMVLGIVHMLSPIQAHI